MYEDTGFCITFVKPAYIDMGHKCGVNCRRKLGTRKDCPACGSATQWLRIPFFAGGKERTMSVHFRRDRLEGRPEVTKDRVTAVLDNWLVRCKTDYRLPGAKWSIGWSHYGWVDIKGKKRFMQVVTTLDDDIIQTVNLNRNALKALQKGKVEWFDKRCLDKPVWRHENDIKSI